MEEKEMELLECTLTEKELLEYGQQLSRRNNEVTRLESQKKATVSEYTAKVDAAKAEINSLSEKVSTGREFRKVEIRTEFNTPINGQKTIIRNDINEIYKVTNMTADEIQDLIIDGERRKKEEEDAKAAEDAKKPKKGKKAKGDTMKVEKDLEDIDAPCGEETEGCCACNNEECAERFTIFGKASECVRKEACSMECPRYAGAQP